MRIEFSGTGEANGAFFKSMQELAEAQWPAELKRMQSLSLITGGEILYDISGFGLEWSPAYRNGSDDPVAWVSAITGERREGKQSPEDGKANH
ncbi:hypothetical protein [Pseudomonas monteilii]|uniref:hypothetical protein n=1 Tax=Pseudomonas monteilii TaxID=76759 RepID=UPI00137901D3|nr:hypothetical protein [Pseudomonas monteilii]NBB07867.1 hypothetical protein [Pseudomonas monteilii]